MAKWIRGHTETLDDPKIQNLPLEAFKAWHNALYFAGKVDSKDGNIGTLDDVAFALRETKEAVTSAFQPLIDAQLIVTDGVTFQIRSWKKRQYKSDSSTERVRRHRKKMERSETVTETPPDTDTDTDTEKGLSNDNPKKLALSKQVLDEALAMFNTAADEIGLSRAQRLTDKRKAAMRQRLDECGGLDGWATALDLVKASPFLRGENDRGWKANIDFILQASSFTKLMEGTYAARTSNQSATDGLKRRLAERAAEMFGGDFCDAVQGGAGDAGGWPDEGRGDRHAGGGVDQGSGRISRELGCAGDQRPSQDQPVLAGVVGSGEPDEAVDRGPRPSDHAGPDAAQGTSTADCTAGTRLATGTRSQAAGSG